MSDTVWNRDEIDSPCQKVCLIHPEAEICIGCNRTHAEIAGWSRMSPDERKSITESLPSRSAKLRPKRRGRAVRRPD